MLTNAEFINFILKGGDGQGAAAESPANAALPDGMEGFEIDAPPAAAASSGTASFARRLLEAAGFGLPQLVERNSVIRSSDAVAKYLPDRASYWPKTTTRPYQTLLFEASMTSTELLKIPAFRSTELHHLDDIEAALARMVSAALVGFQQGGEGVTANVLKGKKEETLGIISLLDQREGQSVRLVCFGTWNKRPEGGLETFQITEQTRFWDRQLAREHLGLLYERQFKKLASTDWQDAFTTTEERKQAEKLLEICTRKAPKEHDIQEGVLDLLDTIAKGFGMVKPANRRRLQAFALPSDHDIGIDPEARESAFGGKNPFGGVTLRDERSRLLGYIVYPLKSKADAARLHQHLKEHNRFHNVLVVYPDEDQASLELWQGGVQLTGKLRKGQGYKDAADVVNLLSRFFVVSKAKVRNPTELAQELAYRARYLRRLAVRQLEDEPNTGPLRNLYKAFKEVLVHDQTEDEFADAFAQTIAYGLLTARWVGNRQLMTDGERLTRQTALKYLPAASPFLNDLFKSALSVKLDDQRGRLLWLVDDIADLLDRIDVAYVFGAGDNGSDAVTDPVIHFYEPFLAAYDKDLKNKRGVFFTPRPVVTYIVRSVHELLQKDFGLEDGLASTDTWGDVAKRIAGLEIPEGAAADEPFVCILDPATGTGTFLFECIDVIERTMKERWRREAAAGVAAEASAVSRWNDYVACKLLPRLFGYELMVASYAVAHLKLAFKLAETGYSPRESQRLNVFLTNSLEPSSKFASPKVAHLFATLGREAQEVDEIKRSKRFTVILGNPPYSIRSANLSDDARALVAPFKFVDGRRIEEKGALQLEKNLNDDYVKFFGLINKMLSGQACGVVGLITNHAYLDNPTFRGFRWSMLALFNSVRILDLHGNSKKNELVPDGLGNENVFDIQQGVAISIMSRTPNRSGLAKLSLAESWGKREAKYRALTDAAFKFETIDAPPPWFKFSAQDASVAAEFQGFVSLADAMPVNSTGMKTHRDAFVIDFDRAPLKERVERFRNAARDQDVAQEFGLADTHGWSLAEARRRIKSRADWESAFRLCLYRPFDVRHIYYHSDLVELPRTECMQHLEGGRNLSLLATRQVTSPPFNHVIATRLVSEMKTCSHDRGTNCFPLYLQEDVGGLRLDRERRVNFSQAFLRGLWATLAGDEPRPQTDRLPRGVAAEDVFHYVYAVLHSASYRVRYAQFLKTEFPRFPLPPSNAMFRSLAELGAELVALHLLESPAVDCELSEYVGAKTQLVEKASYARNTIWIDRAQTAGFKGVPESVWSVVIGGYPVCEKWLKDRRGRVLSKSERAHYQKVLVALNETARIVRKIDEIIAKRGDWPGAFGTRAAEAKK